ncbi:hypothetical protein J6590_096576 [Homalodisca vitripennis]|nr:hypothetical protein J6590_096576 [Homalodisca vitripennis]
MNTKAVDPDLEIMKDFLYRNIGLNRYFAHSHRSGLCYAFIKQRQKNRYIKRQIVLTKRAVITDRSEPDYANSDPKSKATDRSATDSPTSTSKFI